MITRSTWGRRSSTRRVILATASLAIGASLTAAMTTGAAADTAGGKAAVIPGDLLVSRVHYTGTADLITPGVTVLPTGVVAISDGDFAHVWDNASDRKSTRLNSSHVKISYAVFCLK